MKPREIDSDALDGSIYDVDQLYTCGLVEILQGVGSFLMPHSRVHVASLSGLLLPAT